MKRLSFLVTVVLILSCAFHAFAANDGQISESEARSLAWQYFLELSVMSEEECREYDMDVSWQASEWLVRMIGDPGEQYAYNTYSLHIDRITGECAGMDIPALWNPVSEAFKQLRKEQHGNDLFVRWTIQEKYDFKQTFSKLYEDFLLNPPEGKYVDIGGYLLRLIQTDYRLPDEACISQEEATAAAQSALLAAGEVTEKDLTGRYIYSASFLYSEAFNPQGQLVWKIFFIPAPPVSPDYGYYVELDAYTGEALGFVHQIQSWQNPWACEYE